MHVWSLCAQVRAIVDEATNRRRFGQATLLFLDEIHRWNKSQQDALLPHVESGLITLVGATTENPSFSLNSALLSRCRVVVLNKLASGDIEAILRAALLNPAANLPQSIEVPDDVLAGLAAAADGDARAALNALEFAVSISTNPSAPTGTPVVVSGDAVREVRS
jgi:putative ATPase